jgi:hypothetical protein
MKYVGHIAIAVTLLGHQKVAPAIEARVDGGIGWQVVISVCRWVVARFIGKGGVDGNCRWSTCRSALELKCALPHIAAISVPGHAAPTARTAADSHQRTLGRLRISSACAEGAVRSATSVVVFPIAAQAVPVLMASATKVASTLIEPSMRVPPRPFWHNPYLISSSIAT